MIKRIWLIYPRCDNSNHIFISIYRERNNLGFVIVHNAVAIYLT